MGSRNWMKSQKNFAQVPSVNKPRSVFNRSYGYKTTFNHGDLIPVFCQEVLPGDTHKVRNQMFARLNTPIVPFMDNVHLDTFYFFVPNRLTWDNWERFQGAQDNPDDSTDYLIPQVTESTGFVSGDLGDYFGIPLGVADISVNALPFRAYNLIWNDWFRDENLQDSITVETGDGPEADVSYYTLRKRNKSKDYFTSALPWPQKGDSVDLPLGTSAPVYGDGNTLGLWDGTTQFGLERGGTALTAWTGDYNQAVATSGGGTGTQIGNGARVGVVETGASGLYADLTNATSATINSLRLAFQMQSLFEIDARYGTRYVEALYGRFGVISPDFRLQRPEFLGSTRSNLNISSVPQTSSTDATTPQGNLSAFGTISDGGFCFDKSFVEHGYIIGVAVVSADLTYQQGLNRMWSRQTRFDFYEPVLANLGEQEILNKEIYMDGSANDDLVFGYQERWAEYRYQPSLITNKMRSSDPQTLDFWHLSQEFGALPVLNSSFIEVNVPFSRVVAVNTEPEFKLDAYFDYLCIRPMPVFSTPYSLGRF